KEIETRLSLVGAPANEEIDPAPPDGEGFTCQLAGLGIAFADLLAGCRGMRIDHALSLAPDVALVGGDIGPLDRPPPEGGAFDLPVLVGLLLEILEEDVRSLRGRLVLRSGLGRGVKQHQ